MSWLDWLFTPVCPLCQRPTASGDGCFCRDCALQMQSVRQANWLSTQLGNSPPLPVFGWGSYSGLLRRCLRSLKYDRHPEIGDTLGRWMGERWAKERSGRTRNLVVPIPLHADRRQERGFNQAETIARAFCEVTGDRLCQALLRRPRATVPQFGLSAKERTGNVERAFSAQRCERQRWPILLVDDIYTTGSTIAAARRSLEQQGWQVEAAISAAFATLEQSS